MNYLPMPKYTIANALSDGRSGYCAVGWASKTTTTRWLHGAISRRFTAVLAKRLKLPYKLQCDVNNALPTDALRKRFMANCMILSGYVPQYQTGSTPTGTCDDVIELPGRVEEPLLCPDFSGELEAVEV